MGGILDLHRDHFGQCEEHLMAVNAAEGISVIGREDDTALLECKDIRKRLEPHSARNCHAVVAPGLKVSRQLLALLVAEGGAKIPSQHVATDNQACFRCQSRNVNNCVRGSEESQEIGTDQHQFHGARVLEVSEVQSGRT